MSKFRCAQNERKSSGFGLIEVLVTLGLLGVASMGIMSMMDNINTGLKSQKDIEMRTELFQALQRAKNSVDCTATLAAAPASPASGGSPIAIYKRGGSTTPLVNTEGSNFGRFSLVANVMPGNSIELKAASFKVPPTDPRSMLSAPESSFTKKKIGTDVWSWAMTGALMASNFPELSHLCDGLVAGTTTTTTPVINPNSVCPSGKYLSGFNAGALVCTSLPTSTTTIISSTSSTSSPSPSSRQWLLDRDCVSSYPNCSACSAFTTMTCPANPGGLTCSASAGTKCVTPNGCRRYICN